MKRLLYLILALGALAGFYGCKTTEQNYRAAYDAVMAKRDAERAELDSLTDGAVLKSTSNNQRILLVGDNDTMRVTVEYVTMTQGKGIEMHAAYKPFNVVIAQFRQLFNAKAVAQEARDQGYDAFIVHNQRPTYYVVAATCSTRRGALDTLRIIQADTALHMVPPCPWMLVPAQLSRRI